MVWTKTKRNSGLVGRPFPSSPRLLYQIEVKCSVFDVEIIFHSHANKTLIFTERLCSWPHFESEGFWNSEVRYFVRESALTFAYSTDQSHSPKNGRESLIQISWWVLMRRTRIPISNLSTGKNRTTLLNVSFPLERPKTSCAINFPSGRFPEPFCKW